MHVSASDIPETLVLPPENYVTKEHFSQGLDAIASGKSAMFLFTGLFSNLNTPPRCLHKPTWLYGMSLLQYFIKRIRSMGDYGRMP